MNSVNTAASRGVRHRRFRIGVIIASVTAAILGSALLAMRDSGDPAMALGVTATLRVPGHPGAMVVGPDALWVALRSDPQTPVGNRPLVRVDLATGAVTQSVFLDGEATHLTRVGYRLIASVQPVGSDGFRPTRLAVLDWRTGRKLFDRGFDGPIDQVVQWGSELWALEVRPGTLLRLDALTLAPASSSTPFRLSAGRTLGLASAFMMQRRCG